MENSLKPKISIRRCNYIGKITFKWHKQNYFINMVEALGFEKNLRKNGITYQKTVDVHNSGRKCVMVAFTNGTISVNGCDESEIRQVVFETFSQKLGSKLNSYKYNFEITHFRAIVTFTVKFNIETLRRFIASDAPQKEPHKSKPKPSRQKIKNNLSVFVPCCYHGEQKVSIYLSRNGFIDIFRANLIKNLHQFATNFYTQFLSKFAISTEQLASLDKQRIQQRVKSSQNTLAKQQKQHDQNNRNLSKREVEQYADYFQVDISGQSKQSSQGFVEQWAGKLNFSSASSKHIKYSKTYNQGLNGLGEYVIASQNESDGQIRDEEKSKKKKR